MTALLRRHLLLLLPLRQPRPSRSLSSSPVVDFLTESCGLSAAAAATTAASGRLPPISDPSALSNAKAVLSLLRSHHFSPTNIASIVSAYPSLLSTPHDSLPPKLLLLSAAAGDLHHLPALVTPNPSVLQRKMDDHLVPLLDILQTVTSSPDDFLHAVRRGRYLLTCDFRKTLLPNITLLLNTGVPISNVSKLLIAYPDNLTQQADRFADAVSVVQRFGLKPTLVLFVHGVRTISGIAPSTLDRRLEKLRKWGWSEDDIGAAFRTAPVILQVSDEKMERSVDYLVNTMGLSHAQIVSRPMLLMYSLEKRMMPRFAVFRMLEKNGLVDGKIVLWMFLCSNNAFLHGYVKKYSEKLPELEDVYRGENEVEELDLEDMERRFK